MRTDELNRIAALELKNKTKTGSRAAQMRGEKGESRRPATLLARVRYCDDVTSELRIEGRRK